MEDRSIKIQELKEKYFRSTTDAQNKKKIKTSLLEILNVDEINDFEFEVNLKKALEEREKNLIRNEISTISNEKEVVPLRRSYLKRIFSIAAIFALAIFGYYSLRDEASSIDIQTEYLALAQEFHKRSIGKIALRGSGNTSKDTLQNSINLSIKNERINAALLLEDYVNNNPGNELALMNLAINDFILGNYQKSKNSISMLVGSTDPFIRDEVDMLSLQIAIKEDNKSAIVDKLQEIASKPKHKYYTLSKDYLKNYID